MSSVVRYHRIVSALTSIIFLLSDYSIDFREDFTIGFFSINNYLGAFTLLASDGRESGVGVQSSINN